MITVVGDCEGTNGRELLSFSVCGRVLLKAKCRGPRIAKSSGQARGIPLATANRENRSSFARRKQQTLTVMDEGGTTGSLSRDWASIFQFSRNFTGPRMHSVASGVLIDPRPTQAELERRRHEFAGTEPHKHLYTDKTISHDAM